MHATPSPALTPLALDRATALTILVAALGYFVDIFDLLLFGIVRVASLRDLGVSEEGLLPVGVMLINAQMTGLILGGLLWGVLGDRMGRLSVLFGSIVLYSIANIANGFAVTVEQYAILRFVAGVGLAGELGAGVTLASELLPGRWRGLGTAFIASIGLLGAIAAALVAEFTDWRTAYIVGGVMGLGLLIMRINLKESGLFEKMKTGEAKNRGNIFMLLRRPRLATRFVAVVMSGAPIMVSVWMFVAFTPEFTKDFGMALVPVTGTAFLFCYAGLAVGDMASGLFSQFLKSRRKAMAASIFLIALFTVFHVGASHETLASYYLSCALLGFGSGYWAMLVQTGAEQFGTNIRATMATVIPNMVRGLAIPMTIVFRTLIPSLGVTGAGIAIMTGALILAFLALAVLRETFSADLDYIET